MCARGPLLEVLRCRLTPHTDELQYVDEKSKSEQDGFKRLTTERESSQQHVFANELDKWERSITVLQAELVRRWWRRRCLFG